jgi:hypothetical protein
MLAQAPVLAALFRNRLSAWLIHFLLFNLATAEVQATTRKRQYQSVVTCLDVHICTCTSIIEVNIRVKVLFSVRAFDLRRQWALCLILRLMRLCTKPPRHL